MLLTDQVGSLLLQNFIIDSVIQIVFYITSSILKTEKYYDLSGALTNQACIFASLFWRESSLGPRPILLSVLILLWSTRLGIFLFIRVLQVEDKRFSELKKSPITFLIPWLLQIIWIYLTSFAAYIAIGTTYQPDLMWSDYIGIILWCLGFLCETIADAQKSHFKKTFPQDFISTGLFKYSRYPNYFGEILLWIGIFFISGTVLQGWQWIGIISPLFVIGLLRYGSGVALSEANAIKRYGDRSDYQLYRARTSLLIPWFPKTVE